MVEIVVILAALICGALALHAGDSARRVRVELSSMEEDVRADLLHLHQGLAQQDDRIQRMQKAFADLRAETENAVASLRRVQQDAHVPLPPADMPTPRALRG